MARVSVKGLRGRYSPMSDPKTPAAQREAILSLVERLKNGEGVWGMGRDGAPMFSIEVRYSTWIGPNCAAERGDITVCVDGAIAAMVTGEGKVY